MLDLISANAGLIVAFGLGFVSFGLVALAIVAVRFGLRHVTRNQIVAAAAIVLGGFGGVCLLEGALILAALFGLVALSIVELGA